MADSARRDCMARRGVLRLAAMKTNEVVHAVLQVIADLDAHATSMGLAQRSCSRSAPMIARATLSSMRLPRPSPQTDLSVATLEGTFARRADGRPCLPRYCERLSTHVIAGEP
jgi:hypothetical protein